MLSLQLSITSKLQAKTSSFPLFSHQSSKTFIKFNTNVTIKMSQNNSNHSEIIKPYNHVHVVPNPDGTITRLQEFYPTVPPSITNTSSTSLSKDVPLNPEKSTWVRIFLPRSALHATEVRRMKLPIMLFAHGGGFILFSAASPVFHDFCSDMASRLNALVISIEYRLAPENRLPAAYDDVLDALRWLKGCEDEWVTAHGDISRCYLVGQSAGANIVYYAGLRAIDLVDDFKPLIITGLILIQPFFGGLDRTGSELRLINDKYLPLVVSDMEWGLSLPFGADRGHEFCDPTVGGGSDKLSRVNELGLVIVVGCDGDPLLDRQVEFVKLLETKSVKVFTMFSDSGRHGVFAGDPTKKEELFKFLELYF